MYLILGFDAKVTVPVDWNSKRRDDYLLCKDRVFPKSVDDMVWPSIFDVTDELKRPSFTGIFQKYWQNLDELQQHVKHHQGEIVAVALEMESCLPKHLNEWNARLSGFSQDQDSDSTSSIPIVARPDNIDDTFTFIGYDVADEWGLSGLMNCGGYTESELNDERVKSMISSLNANHLSNSYPAACQFAEYCNSRVKEHAPFFVYSIWSKKLQ